MTTQSKPVSSMRASCMVRSSVDSNPPFGRGGATFMMRGTSADGAVPPKRLSDASTGSGLISTNNSFGSTSQLSSSFGSKRLSLDSRTSFGDPSHQMDHGILITLHKCDTTTQCELSFTADHHYTDLHPNAYAPACLSKMHKLGGGGSGVAVFEGHHPQLGDVVMKHGGDKDLKELFALATIAEELKQRGKQDNATQAAAQALQSSIPEFKFIYISPHHLGEKRRELWYRLSHLYKYSSRNLLVLPETDETTEPDPVVTMESSMSELPNLQEEQEEEGETTTTSNGQPETTMEEEKATPLKARRQKRAMMRMMTPAMPSRNGLSMTQSGTVSGHRDISVYEQGLDGQCSVELLGDSLTISIPPSETTAGDGWRESIVIPGDGYVALKAIAQDLHKLMKDHKWKFTLGQKRIGGAHPKTGNLWLYAGQLEGKLLDNLIAQKIKLVRDLVTLTTEQERDPQHLRAVQEEVVKFEEEEDIGPGDISALSDSFVGNAIKKNFQEASGRVPVGIALGKQFREFSQHHPRFKRVSSSQSDLSSASYGNYVSTEEDTLVLQPEEEIPAYHLGCLTRAGALMGDSFEKVPLEPTVLGMNRYYWRTVLRAAVLPRVGNQQDAMAVTRVWTCGLTDAGLHNLFLSDDSFWLFDLGQPQLYSAPGFLTKFLFSFFHTLGMQETPDGQGWVRRFEHNPVTNKLVLTPETEKLLSKAYDAFEITLDRLIEELFGGDDSLRWLLIQYVTLQLISDASFCLQRWTIKGGGRPRDANHQTGIEKWLWRAIWDMYVAFDINTNDTWTRLYVEHPSHRDSRFFEDMRDLIVDAETRAALERLGEEGEKESKQEETSTY